MNNATKSQATNKWTSLLTTNHCVHSSYTFQPYTPSSKHHTRKTKTWAKQGAKHERGAKKSGTYGHILEPQKNELDMNRSKTDVAI
ncbi:hypothetical protein EUGRSUZ_C01651 [Eucalyptus grandis]|uniref:Uncharacterized protein n=2 Tax=Eucalyptus grandis TaxID=71139 RepID=A0ACC3LE45_EUCGR|nr:hypothetical protein EUGRSUZ_C01651 [Eucalyptus grandis]